MKLRSIEISRKFTPEFNGNKELPLEEQIVIELSRVPGTSEKNTYVSYGIGSTGSMELIYKNQLMITAFVKKIENLNLNGKDIKTGRDLAVASHSNLSGLFGEIRDHLFPDEDLDMGESTA